MVWNVIFGSPLSYTLPKITTKQQTILKLIYKYRFLNTKQIQALLKHKDKRRIISWLKDLREKEYVDWHYDATDFITKSKPAIYFLSLGGIRYLRELGIYPDEELRKRYKESTRTQAFIDRCLLIADSCIALQAKSNDKLQYDCVLAADYVDPDSEYYFLNELKPHLFLSKQLDDETANYLLENFEQTLPRYQLSKRLKDYVEYLTYEWDDNNGPLPITLLACATIADLLYVKRRVRRLIENEEDVQIRVTMLDKLKDGGVTNMIWEDIH